MKLARILFVPVFACALSGCGFTLFSVKPQPTSRHFSRTPTETFGVMVRAASAAGWTVTSSNEGACSMDFEASPKEMTYSTYVVTATCSADGTGSKIVVDARRKASWSTQSYDNRFLKIFWKEIKDAQN